MILNDMVRSISGEKNKIQLYLNVGFNRSNEVIYLSVHIKNELKRTLSCMELDEYLSCFRLSLRQRGDKTFSILELILPIDIEWRFFGQSCGRLIRYFLSRD
jgi:hypothetical protein